MDERWPKPGQHFDSQTEPKTCRYSLLNTLAIPNDLIVNMHHGPLAVRGK